MKNDFIINILTLTNQFAIQTAAPRIPYLSKRRRHLREVQELCPLRMALLGRQPRPPQGGGTGPGCGCWELRGEKNQLEKTAANDYL